MTAQQRERELRRQIREYRAALHYANETIRILAERVPARAIRRTVRETGRGK